jgi:ribosomal protein S18 acetylase RimI-like enzyme
MTIRLPIPLDWPQYTWRPARIEDVPALYETLLAIDKADDRQTADTLADLKTQFDDPWSNPETETLFAFTPAGQVAAFARTFMNPQPEEEARAFLWTEVHPDHRGDGLEDFLLDWAEARAVERLQAAPDGMPRVLRCGLQDTLAGQIARLERRGFAPARYFYRMRRDLRDPIPDRSLAAGLTLRTFTPDLSKPVQAAINEAFRDHWSFEPITDEDWQQFFVKRSAFRPDLTFVVMDGDQVAGCSFNTVSPEENARYGIQEGWIAELAVRRPWRKRGIATALLCESMRAFKAEGLDFATLGVDTANLSGALRLYERVGFKPFKRFIQFARPVEEPG